MKLYDAIAVGSQFHNIYHSCHHRVHAFTCPVDAGLKADIHCCSAALLTAFSQLGMTPYTYSIHTYIHYTIDRTQHSSISKSHFVMSNNAQQIAAEQIPQSHG